jgi:polysaccharide biosynthesis/export protein
MASRFLVVVLAVGVAATSMQTVLAQTPPASTPTTPPAPQTVARAGEVPTDYVVGPGDVLNITVFGEPLLTGIHVRVDADGTIPFQYLNKVKAEDLTVAQISDVLRKGLADGYLRNPQISVEVEQYHSQNVYVLGEVKAPAKYSLPGNSTLVDVLMQAGSTTPAAGHWVLINHARAGSNSTGPVTSDDNTADLRINLSDIQSGKAQNIKILDGDTTTVPKAERIYVNGNVRTPGAFPFDDGMTVFEAMALAGGVTEKGSNTRVSIKRLINGQMKELDVKQTDILKPGDQVFVKARRL